MEVKVSIIDASDHLPNTRDSDSQSVGADIADDSRIRSAYHSSKFSPWQWRPASEGLFSRIQLQANHWTPSEGLGLNGEKIRQVIQEEAANQARWLIHPCLNPITHGTADSKAQRDFQLAVWTAINTSHELGIATVRSPVWAWSPGGGKRLEPGSYSLAELGAQLQAQPAESPIPIDPWAKSVKLPFHQLWRDVAPLSTQHADALAKELQLLLRALSILQSHLPDCLDWVRNRTQVIVPLRRISGEHASSSSVTTLAGVVFLTIHNELQVIEALVHESAHQHLFTAEALSPLVHPDHYALYSSPLRDDPRPLRGILLACHALAYMAAIFTDAGKVTLFSSSEILERQVTVTKKKFAVALEILVENRRYLTSDGRSFLDLTEQVGNYSA